MNLNSIVASLIGSVNPRETVTVYRSLGNAISPDGMRSPSYSAGIVVIAQIQAQPTNDLQHMNGILITGERVVMYMPGQFNGVSRDEGLGGDIVVRADGTRWLITVVTENWGDQDGWCQCLCVRQKRA